MPMTKMRLLLLLQLFFMAGYAQNYHTLWIPDTLSGTTFNLSAKDTFQQFLTGNQTVTAAFNGSFWGPTLFWNKGDTVHMNITNLLQDSTTVHWHGMHLPAVMDGGPHQVIPPNTVWQPYWKVENNAATYWYHPHLHMEAVEQITEGLGGLIIIRDSVESALPLPRTYGVDDIPLILSDRSFNASNAFTDVPYGDSMVTNGVLSAQYTLPAQMVRLRVLDAAIERAYNLGMSDGSTFYVISTDGGLVDTPVAVTRFLLSPGERVELVINLTGKSGSLDLKAFNSALNNTIGGGENFSNGPFANALGHKDFAVLHINIGAQTSSPVTSLPAWLTTNTFYNADSANLTRLVTITDSTGVTNPPILGPNAFILDHMLFSMTYNNYTVPYGNTEIWQITNSTNFGHPFHIHDVQFYTLSVNGSAAPAYQQGWKDVILVEANATVKFIAKFTDYSDTLHPYMFHCHIALHEDEGMMGQFIVQDTASAVSTGISTLNANATDFSLFPNPAGDKIFVKQADEGRNIYYARIIDHLGRTCFMLPRPDLRKGFDISSLSNGHYFLQLTDDATKLNITKPFVKEQVK